MTNTLDHNAQIKASTLTGTNRIKFSTNNLKISTRLAFLNEKDEIIRSWYVSKEINFITQLIYYKSIFLEPMLEFDNISNVLTITWLIKENSLDNCDYLADYTCDCSCIRKVDSGIITAKVSMLKCNEKINVVVEVR